MALWDDIRAIRRRDPAAFSSLQVLLLYPGVHALIWHRLANWLWRHGARLPAAFVAAASRFLTGIEIHPAAQVGQRLFIDHGMGVAIGETARIGDDCTIYQGVTLGATVMRPGQRHPVIGNGVVIGAGAKLLGPITVGDEARIAPNAVVVRNIAARARVVQTPATVMEL